MGFVEDIVAPMMDPLGLVMGDGGPLDTKTGFKAGAARIQDPTTQKQIDTAYDQTQTGIQQQQDFLNALQAQNGIQNQTNTFNQLQGVANGSGPNPAQAALNQATSANVANQAALMAGQRGTSQNAGMLARQAAQQGGNIQQQAAGQSATMQAGQQLNAMNAMGNLATNQVNQQAGATQGYNQAVQGQQQNLLNARGGYNNALVTSQTGINNANQANSAAEAGAKAAIVGGALGGAGAAMSDERQKKNIQPADAKLDDMLSKVKPHSYEYKEPSMEGAGEGKFVSPMAQELEQSEVGQSMVTEGPNGKMVDYAKGMGAMLAAQGMLHKRIEELESHIKGNKEPKKMASGGVAGLDEFERAMRQAPLAPKSDSIKEVPNAAAMDPAAKPVESKAGDALTTMGKSMGSSSSDPMTKGMTEFGRGLGEQMRKQQAPAPSITDNGNYYDSMATSPMVASKGAVVPGKAKVAGNSLKNDTVPAKLSPGEIVLPRSVTMSEDPVAASAKFVEAIMAKHSMQAEAKPKKRKK